MLAHCPEELTQARADAERLPSSLTAVTLLTFRESVRPDATETLDYFAEQGVAVRIISGDNPADRRGDRPRGGRGRPVGIRCARPAGGPAELGEVLEEHVVFGRVTPSQKKDIVTALQRRGHTVAMTGDGVNDALAIKEADIGIAMDSGSAATKAVARIVLLDGRFSQLPGVVAEGRQVIANIERVSMLFLTKTAYATALAVLFGVMLLPFPFLPRQLSVVDGLTIGLPSFFLALMPNRRRYVPGFLRRSLGFAIPAGIIIALVLALYSRMATDAGIPQDELRTGSTMILTIVGLWVLIVLSRPIDGWKILIIGSMMLGLVLVYAVPFIADFLQFTDSVADDRAARDRVVGRRDRRHRGGALRAPARGRAHDVRARTRARRRRQAAGSVRARRKNSADRPTHSARMMSAVTTAPMPNDHHAPPSPGAAMRSMMSTMVEIATSAVTKMRAMLRPRVRPDAMAMVSSPMRIIPVPQSVTGSASPEARTESS